MSVLRVEHLSRRFGKKIAVDDLHVEARGGEILGLLGPNGAGKSTTFLCLAGLIRPDSGTIALDGRILGRDRGASVALIPETPEVYPLLTVWEHLVFVARSARLPDGWQARGLAMLDRLGIANERDTLGSSLSKGMRQKTLIAATTLTQAPIVLFDEPMIGLDPRGQRELRDVIVGLRDEGRIVIVSTHLLESAQSLCNRVAILKSGRLVVEGEVADLRGDGAGRSLEEIFLEITA